MKRRLLTCVVASLLFIWMTGMANATLIGDTVSAGHFYPDILTEFIPKQTTVVADDSSDAMFFSAYGMNAYKVDVNASSFTITSLLPYGHNMPLYNSSFNGLVISSINDNTGNPIKGVSVNTNAPMWDDSRVTFTDDSVAINWQGLTMDSESWFVATLDFGSTPTATPIPTAFFLFITGLVSISGLRRKKLS